MNPHFSSDFFLRNRTKLHSRSQAKLVVIAANVELQRNGDVAYDFRQDSNFWYLTGIDEPNFVLVMSKNDTFLIKPTRHPVKDMFDGVVDDDELRRASGIDEILDERQGWQKLTSYLKKNKVVTTQLPMQDKHFNITGNPARQKLLSKMRRKIPGLHIKDIRTELAAMRMVKQDEELAVIQQAIDITCTTIQQLFVADWFKKFKAEYQIEAAIDAGFRARGASGNSFPSIVAAGTHACQIHHVKNDGLLSRDELLLVDVGAEVGNYAADISRTLPIGKTMSKRQNEVFSAVQDVQKYATSLLKPGVFIREYELEVEEYMGKTLKNLGLITKLDRKNIRKFYPHATSHMMGLDVHDAADYAQPLAENMVLTVEPGIYIPKEGLGVRIEDDVVVTSSGARVLSEKLPIRLW